jgi:flagellar biosynthetic protein FliS
MKPQSSAISAYTNALATRSPLHAVVGLYDLAIVHIVKAADAADRRDYEQQFNESMRAAQILNGLSCCLDMNRGGTVAISLRDMYQAVVSALLRAVGKKTATVACLRLAEAVRLTRNAWAEIAKLPLSVKSMEITPLNTGEVMEATGFTKQKQSVMNSTRQGKLGLSKDNRKLETFERPSDATSGLSGKSPEARRRSIDMA